MFSNIKIKTIGLVFCLSIFTFFFAKGQEKETENTSDACKENVFISLGYFQPFPVGNNMVNEAYSVSGGFEHSVWVHTALDIWIGAKLTIFDADVGKMELTGTYSDANIFSIGPMLGYRFHLHKKIGLLLGASVGYVKYTNHHSDYEFYDDGTSLGFVANFDYDWNDHFGLYFSGSFRRDFLKIEAQGLEENYFDPNYIQLSVGIRITI